MLLNWEFSQSAFEENPFFAGFGGGGGKKRYSHFCPILFILSNPAAFTSALEAPTCGSTQPDLMKEPRGRLYNKAGWSSVTV